MSLDFVLFTYEYKHAVAWTVKATLSFNMLENEYKHC